MGILVYGRQLDKLYSGLGEMATFATAEMEAKEKISCMNVEIVFIDLSGWEEEGMQLARYIRSIHRYYLIPIIFLADNDKYEREAWRKIRCYEFLHYPISITKIREIVFLLQEKLDPLYVPKGLVVKIKGEVFRIETEDIFYIEILNKHLVIHAQYGRMEFPYHPIRECVLQARGDLVQCHRSMAVNRHIVKKINFTKRYIEINGYLGRVPLGPKYVKEIHAIFDSPL